MVRADDNEKCFERKKSMFQISAATIAISLECLIGTATLYIAVTLYSNGIDALTRVFG